MAEYAIAAAIPVFFALIALELWVARRRGQNVYRLADAISCLSCGIGQQMTGLLWKAALFAVYIGVYELAALTTWPADHWVTWLVAMLLVDHQYYWWHRTTHRSRAFWTTHVVHHQSEDYNLAVALRQAWFSSFSSLPFYLPLAVLGIPPVVFVVSNVLNTLYQFWIHTELIDRMPRVIEAVWNTPSHHRVHHAVDPVYIDKNYAGILIVWDRLYGTFEPETHRPTYGTVTPFQSTNPVWANLEPLVSLARGATTQRRLGDGIWYLLGPPEWRPAHAGGPVVIPTPEPPHRRTFDPVVSGATGAYVLAQFAVTGIVVTTTLALSGTWPPAGRLVAIVGVVLTTVVWSGLFERRPWAKPLEALRLLALACVPTVFGTPEPLLIAGAVYVLASAIALTRLPGGTPP